MVWTNTKEASPTSMVVPMPSFSFDLKSAGSATLSGSNPVARMTPTSPEEAPSAVDRNIRTASEPMAEEAPAEQPAALAADAVPGSSLPEHLATERAAQIELIIDSLPKHQLIKTIPVTVEALGDKVFTAAIRDLNLAGTGNTLGEALLIVKEQVDILYDQLTKSSRLSDDEELHLKFLQSHILGPTFSDNNEAQNNLATSSATFAKSKKFSWR
jgi:hypothetical protein